MSHTPVMPHLPALGSVTLGRRRAFPIVEEPSAKDFESIRKMLSVESSPRWEPKGGLTYCNIYVYDFMCALGIPFPRVWWRDDYVVEGMKGNVTPIYGQNVRELNVNALVPWMKKYGEDYGWEYSTRSKTLLKSSSNVVGVVLASNKDRRRSGHTSVVFPGAEREDLLFQSQAGSTNKELFQGSWWKGSSFKEVLFCWHTF